MDAVRARERELKRALEEISKKLASGSGGQADPFGALAGLAGSRPPSSGAGPVEARRPAGTRAVAGRKCRKVEFVQGGEVVCESWYTESPAPQWMRRMDLDESPGAENAALLAARGAEAGLELESALDLPGGGRYEVLTTKVEERPLPPSLFQAPQGFRNATQAAPAGGPGR